MLHISIIPKESSGEDQQLYQSIMAEVHWFLLDLFFLGYVEDPSSGLSFRIPSQLNWECYFEVHNCVMFHRLVMLQYQLK